MAAAPIVLSPLHAPAPKSAPETLDAIIRRLEMNSFVQNGHTAPTTRKVWKKDDILRFQFPPNAMAFGSQIGREFIQMLAGTCDTDVDRSRKKKNGEPLGYHKSYLAFNFDKQTFAIKAVLKFGDGANLPPALRPLDAELPFEDITSHGISLTHVKEFGLHRREPVYKVTMTIGLRRPPKFYTEFEENDNMFGREGVPYRRRATAMDFGLTPPDADRVTEITAGPIQAIPEGPCGYPTFWNTWRWVFALDQRQWELLQMCVSRMRAIGEEDPDLDLLSNWTPMWTIRRLDEFARQSMYGLPDLSGIRFSTRTLVEGLIAHGILRPGDVRACAQALQQNAIVPAFQDRILESFYNEERIRNVARLVQTRASFLRRTNPPKLSHLVLIRSVLVTPTRLLINPPSQEPSNSVTRRYADRLDAILRVQFADEEDKLMVLDYTKRADHHRPDVGIIARVRRALQHGIIVGGRRYMPVASSSSQQKDHAMWFIDTQMIDRLELNAWMGEVKETIIAKHAARMGLPFSTSRIVNLDVTLGPKIPDIERNDSCFTDGVGLGGAEVMQEAARALGFLRGINSKPSAIQFRLGGAKGMLACWPDLVKPHEIKMRPSMVKFHSKLKDLNVVRIAKYQVAFLNRQFILIMCHQGIPEELMMDLFEDAVSSIKGLRQRVAQRMMSKSDHQLIAQCSEFPLGQVIRAGFHGNPLVLDICSIIETRALQDLKWRARVRLPTGVFLIGIADETGTLQEGEVFCQYQEGDDTKPVIVQSEVIVCRAPALHPGDVRRAFAVDNPLLHHLKNVIVFSTQGKRALPNMLGGGDLDGDDFTLIWDQRFVQPLRVHEPMDYTAPEPKRVDHVTQSDLNENFAQYILNDVLGQVDNTHLALSDFHDEGPSHPDCMKLSEIHSIAVDFPKTGIAAELDPGVKPRTWPDFMDKDEFYESQKILGRIFRIVQPDPHFQPTDIAQLCFPTEHFITVHPIYHSLLDKLRPVKAHYEHVIQHDMRRYRCTEIEIPSGIALKNRKRKRARDQNLNEPLRDAYKVHVEHARNEALEVVSTVNFSTTRLTAAQVVARHCYALTFEEEHVREWEAQCSRGQWDGNFDDDDRVALRPCPMTSFAWVFWPELVEIANLAVL